MPIYNPIDIPDGGKLALAGHILCMDNNYTELPRGIVYIDKGVIIDLLDENSPIPEGFESVETLNTGGLIFPGLIELHNHLSYNTLQLWNIPKHFTNREQWARTPDYFKMVSAPMTVIGKTPQLLPAVVRYVETKCLMAGITTSQGIRLASNAGICRYYRGIVRNVEQTDDPDLPEATTRIADVEASDVYLFLARLNKSNCLLLHLSEGINQKAREHFLALKINNNKWAINEKLVGIHSTGLLEEDLEILAANNGGLVWSPFSNLLLYGETAKIMKAKELGIRIGLGSDWSPSGSKNLLGELKVAKIYSTLNGGALSDREIVSLATKNGASLLGWQKVIGSIEKGKKADLAVIPAGQQDPYASLIKATEKDILLVIINGIARYGERALMNKLGEFGEILSVGGKSKLAFLKQNTQDPAVNDLSLIDAQNILTDALKRLPELAAELEKPKKPRLSKHPVWTLALDEIYDTGVEIRPRLPLGDTNRLTGPDRLSKAPPLSQIVVPLNLDPLTVDDDPDFFNKIDNQKNLPVIYKVELKKMYE